ncbi:MAG: aminopeptidase P N-terminal domain-containing protein, partial [Flammeovirgaceae bacterium]
MKHLLFAAIFGFGYASFAQNTDLPADFLSKDFHKNRREKLREKLPANAVAVFFANPVRNRANDVEYVYHQDPDFFYLTGYREPNAVLFVFKENQTAANGTQYNEIIFVQPRDAGKEMWTGRRLGDKGVKDILGFNQAFNNTDFKKYNVNFTKFDKVLFYDFFNDVRNDERDSADLFDLQAQFKAKVNFPEKGSTTLAVEPIKNNIDLKGLESMMDDLRGIKTQEEIELVKRAVQIS